MRAIGVHVGCPLGNCWKVRRRYSARRTGSQGNRAPNLPKRSCDLTFLKTRARFAAKGRYRISLHKGVLSCGRPCSIRC
ncbi:hypothetical protein CSE45_3547 [Citreicella sp. SE45]|nr:hypothetical protein CSE45_3547 [Citreicella sp. SE45]